MKSKKILLTGATGNMGLEALKQLVNQDCHLVLLVRPLKKNERLLKPFMKHKNMTIIWGDLTKPIDVDKAVEGVDMIFHMAALVSPMADRQPDLAWSVNYGGTKNLVDAVKKVGREDWVQFVYIGTVAETGNRPMPIHYGRVGDPILPSPFDYYALSKIAGERYVIESGLEWVSLRQTGILHTNLLKMQDGIEFHQPLNNCLEWITSQDSGRLIANLAIRTLPEAFWNACYNIGGGESCRMTAYDFMSKIFDTVNLDFRDFYNPNMFALRNFHGHYYLDSDVLEDYLNFREQSIEDFALALKSKIPLSMKVLRFLPKELVKGRIIKACLSNPNTPLYWIKHNIEDKISAYFGSKENWAAIGDWEDFQVQGMSEHKFLSHGYDLSKPIELLRIEDMESAARFRGGKCLSETMVPGDMTSKLTWQCALGHIFEASPYLVLKAGHWCETCLNPPWNFDALAKTSPFFSQVWHEDHAKDENKLYK